MVIRSKVYTDNFTITFYTNGMCTINVSHSVSTETVG